MCVCELISGLCYLFCSLKFNENYNLVLREPFNIMPHYMDLIAEVRKRPVLWYNSNARPWSQIADAWKEVALCLGVDSNLLIPT